MEEIYRQRIARVQSAMQQQDLDYVLLSVSPDLLYLTGYSTFVSERLHLLVVPPSGRPTIVLPDFEKGMVARLAASIDIVGWPESEGPISYVVAALAPHHLQAPVRIAVADHTWALFLLRIQAALPRALFVPASQIMAPLRRAKDAVELGLLKEAQDLAIQALRRLLERPLAGRTERQVGAELRHHCETVGFETTEGALIGSGPNGALPHLTPTDRVIQRGEPVVIDFGSVYKGYYSDCTRTVHVGPPSDGFQEVFEIVRRANHAARDAARPGVTCESVDHAARRVIEEAGYGPFFTHRLGHGIGLEVHEEPYMVQGNRLLLEPGVTFTDEPGIYLPGRFGCRLEDVLAVTEDGRAVLTDYTHDLIVVD